VEGAGNQLGILVVTVLTSFDDAPRRGDGPAGDSRQRRWRELADVAAHAGAHGIVCSGARPVQCASGSASVSALLIPGIRMRGGAVHDQRRVVTPAEAASRARVTSWSAGGDWSGGPGQGRMRDAGDWADRRGAATDNCTRKPGPCIAAVSPLI
jgi:hypothetical protein